jgi:hypothetical protein
MADPDQMSREELLKAKERVELHLERLRYRPFGRPTVTMRPNKSKNDLVKALSQILDEINAELAETEPKRA